MLYDPLYFKCHLVVFICNYKGLLRGSINYSRDFQNPQQGSVFRFHFMRNNQFLTYPVHRHICSVMDPVQRRRQWRGRVAVHRQLSPVQHIAKRLQDRTKRTFKTKTQISIHPPIPSANSLEAL